MTNKIVGELTGRLSSEHLIEAMREVDRIEPYLGWSEVPQESTIDQATKDRAANAAAELIRIATDQ